MPDITELVTVPDVEIASTGIEYQLGSGPRTFTQEQLEAAVGAINDPGVNTPRIKIGHDGPLADITGSDQPALGLAANLRMSDDRQSIYADLVGVPKWLADVMPSAYPSRSIEGDLNVESGTGKKHDLVLTAVSLLGVTMPGISTIDDLKQVFSEEGPELAVQATGGSKMPERAVQAAVDMEDIRRQYYDNLDASQMWWWVRAIRLEPNELIVDDDEGSLYRVPFEVSDDVISFSDPVKVKVEYVDLPAGEQETSTEASAPVKVFATRAESRPDQQEVKAMTPEEIRESLGLAADASDEELRERLKAVNEATPEGDPPKEDNDDDEEEEEEEEESQEEKPATSPVPEGMALVDEATLEELRNGASQGIAARTAQVEQSDREIIDAAVRVGKIPPSRRDHYRTMLVEADRDGATRLLTASVEEGGLAPGLIPVDERGTALEETDATSHERVMAGAFGITKEKD